MRGTMKTGIGVAGKLALAISLFIVPAGFLSVLLYKSQQVNIDFSEKEAVGNHYLTELRAVHAALVDPTKEIDPQALKATIAKADAEFGAEMEAADQAQAAQVALDAKDTARDTAALN